MSFLIGQNVGDYAIHQQVGGGGFGRVYKVEHTLTRRREAMKVLAVGQADSEDQSERFLREIRLQASLNHPNIAAVLNAFCTDDHVILICELLEGEPLKSMLERGPLPLTQALDIMSQVLSALSYAHARGVIHGDISPTNIFVTASSGTVKLIDFGLARAAADLHLTQDGSPGSFHYMSPEQVRGLQMLDSRTDIYSCGAILYELTTGQKLFDGNSGFAIRQAHAHQPPLAPKRVNQTIPPLLEEAILKAVAKKPEERFQSADSLYQAIQQVRMKLDRPGSVDASVPSYSLPGKVLWCTTGLLLTIAIVVGGVRRESSGNIEQPHAPVPAILPVSPLPDLPEPPVTKPVKSIVHNTSPHPAPVPHPVVRPQTAAAAEDPSIGPAPKSRLGKLKGSLKRLNPFGRKAVETAATPE